MNSEKKIIYKNVLAIIENQIKKTNVIIQGEKIEEIVDYLSVDYNQSNSIIINGEERLYLYPGFIDPHVHFRTPGKENAENWLTGSRAAIFAGVTSVLDMPNTSPATTSQDAFNQKEKIIQIQSLINYGIIPGFTGNNLKFLQEEKKYKAVKVYLASSTGNLLLKNIQKLEDLNSLDTKIIVHSEDEDRINSRYQKIQMKKIQNHSKIRDEKSAFFQTQRLLEKSVLNKKSIHIAHVSTKKEFDLLILLGISFEVSVNHLYFYTKKYKDWGAQIKCNPPIRKKMTRDYLLKKFFKKEIPMIATDHAPHLFSEKRMENPPSGIPSIQFASHFVLDALRKDPVYTSQVLSTNAAHYFQIKKRGKILPGYYADLALVDYNHPWDVSEKMVLSACKWTPYLNASYRSKVVLTTVNGIVYDTKNLHNLSSDNETRIHNVWRN